MSEHTPGPWVAFPNHSGRGADPDCYWSVDGFHEHRCERCGSPQGPPCITDTVRRAADARLMAAAPDLLEALEAMQEDYADAALEWDTDAKWKAMDLLKKSGSAIAKARGET